MLLSGSCGFIKLSAWMAKKFDIKIAKILFWMRASTPALPTALPLHPHWERTRRPPFYKCGIPTCYTLGPALHNTAICFNVNCSCDKCSTCITGTR